MTIMQHRHLLPNEIDLVLDGEVGFGVAPLLAHLDECPVCRARLAAARVVVDALEGLPHFAPPLRFADKVMADVQVLEPWHVAVLDAFRRFLPQSGSLRVVTAVTASVVAAVISLSAVWLAFRADAAIYALELVAGRARAALASGAAAVAGQLFGQPGVEAIRSGAVDSLLLVAGLVIVAVGGAAFGFRSLTTASRRVRE